GYVLLLCCCVTVLSLVFFIFLFFFFFQAEDGIRDFHVTGVQTCALPISFKQVSDTETMLMGDLVLLESEVGPVLGKLQDGGLEQTALHNHLQHQSPRVMYMHIAGRGTPATLAAALHAALALTTTPFGVPAAAPPGRFGIDTG